MGTVRIGQTTTKSHDKNGVHAAFVFGGVGDLRVFAPNDLASGGDQTQFAHVQNKVNWSVRGTSVKRTM